MRIPLVLSLLLAACAAPEPSPVSPVPDAEPFTVVVLPDTQYLTLSPENMIFRDMMSWIRDNLDELHIEMVLQEGDITHNNTEAEWVEADAGFAMLDGVVPYIVCVGNHDMESTASRDTANYNQWFGLDRLEEQATFYASSSTTSADDHAHVFTAGGIDWMVLSLAYDPTDEALAWGAELVAEHPDHRVIVLTHAYLLPSGTTGPQGEGIQSRIVDPNPNVRMVLNGHYTDGTHAHRRRARDDGSEVLEIFANYQTMPSSGGGRMRQMYLDPVGGTVDVQSCNAFDHCSEEEGDVLFFEDLVF